MGEFGVYELIIKEPNNCDFNTVLKPVSIFLRKQSLLFC